MPCKYKKEYSDIFLSVKFDLINEKQISEIYSTINKVLEKYNWSNHENTGFLNNNEDILESNINTIIEDIIRNSKIK